ncbi:GerAB/ArcD/ProY family transporter [Wukongibacter sp. M2B1]|uniref:GerAB/ArcD/ProY family transporter n=1 Tax=Wukongibacter sp. M2B1 TaxID=3088895 RepID=UPI003D7B8FC2
MNKETISDKQGKALVILFIIGISIIYESGIKAKKDICIAITSSLILAFLLATMYARITYIFSNKSLFDICEIRKKDYQKNR